jgi:hypothetical protein
MKNPVSCRQTGEQASKNGLYAKPFGLRLCVISLEKRKDKQEAARSSESRFTWQLGWQQPVACTSKRRPSRRGEMSSRQAIALEQP